jgi:Fe2+ or Zn2+ uptake regulation protein
MKTALDRTRLREILRERGLRITGPRLAVYEAFQSLGGHRTVDEIHGQLERVEVGLTRASVYNVVADLEGAGLLCRPYLGAGAVRYELASGDHDHFLCRVCGEVMDVPVPRERVHREQSRLPAGAVVEESHLVHCGVCGDCVKRGRGD